MCGKIVYWCLLPRIIFIHLRSKFLHLIISLFFKIILCISSHHTIFESYFYWLMMILIRTFTSPTFALETCTISF